MKKPAVLLALLSLFVVSCKEEVEGPPSDPAAIATDATFATGFDKDVRGVTVTNDGSIYVSSKRRLYKVTPEGQVSTFVGSGMPGIADGQGTAATFATAGFMKADNAGNLYISDSSVIRKVSLSTANVTTVQAINESNVKVNFYGGQVNGFGLVIKQDTLYAMTNSKTLYKIANGKAIWFVGAKGGAGSGGYVDGTGESVRFFSNLGMTLDAGGNIFLADNAKIRKVTPASVVSSFAGQASVGYKDGSLSEALFNNLTDVVFDKSGIMYVADRNNHRIRKITTDGTVSTIAGADYPSANLTETFSPSALAVDKESKYLYAVGQNNGGRLVRIKL